MIRLMLADVRAKARWCYADDSARALLKVLLSDGTFAMLAYRVMQWARSHGLGPLEWVFNKFTVAAGGCIIGRGAEFGPGFVLIHSMGVVINGQVKGGAGIHIEHQVTIGAERRASPRLGDNVFIGAGAKIVGGVVIGSHTRIGANAVVIDDVPDYATAVGIPARVVSRRPPVSPDFSTTLLVNALQGEFDVQHT
jgi:serine O-acetyltransferase